MTTSDALDFDTICERMTLLQHRIKFESFTANDLIELHELSLELEQMERKLMADEPSNN